MENINTIKIKENKERFMTLLTSKKSFHDSFNLPIQDLFQTLLIIMSEHFNVLIHIFICFRNCKCNSCLINKFPIFFILFLRLCCLKICLEVLNGFFILILFLKKFCQIIRTIRNVILGLRLFSHAIVFVQMFFCFIDILKFQVTFCQRCMRLHLLEL